jgi:hypothetical protein
MSVWSVPIAAQADPSTFLEGLLSTRINIGTALRIAASDSQNVFRALLVTEAQRDPSFPRLLVEADQDFIGGSFARRTKIAPLDDIDIYIPLDGGGFVHACPGMQSCPLLSDNPTLWNPLQGSKWMGAENISSGALLDAFADVLRQYYPDTAKIRKPAGEAVRVMTSQDLGDLGYNVTPCLVLDYPHARELRVYLVPDGNNGWIRTNPRYDAALTDALSARNKNFRKAVKIVKFWNSNIFRNTLNSYYIELALQKAALEHVSKSNDQRIEPLSCAVAFAFSALNQAVRLGSLNSWVTGAPRVMPGALSASDFDLIDSLSSVASQAWEQERQWQLQEAILRWELIFGA